jgi:hypothetical protein
LPLVIYATRARQIRRCIDKTTATVLASGPCGNEDASMPSSAAVSWCELPFGAGRLVLSRNSRTPRWKLQTRMDLLNFLSASQAREKHMEHNHGSEYRVKTVRRDGTEELSGWMDKEQVAPYMAAARKLPRKLQGKTYWLQERNVLCPNCLDREQRILEYALTDGPSPRYSPHDSHYLRAVGRT